MRPSLYKILKITSRVLVHHGKFIFIGYSTHVFYSTTQENKSISFFPKVVNNT